MSEVAGCGVEEVLVGLRDRRYEGSPCTGMSFQTTCVFPHVHTASLQLGSLQGGWRGAPIKADAASRSVQQPRLVRERLKYAGPSIQFQMKISPDQHHPG